MRDLERHQKHFQTVLGEQEFRRIAHRELDVVPPPVNAQALIHQLCNSAIDYPRIISILRWFKHERRYQDHSHVIGNAFELHLAMCIAQAHATSSLRTPTTAGPYNFIPRENPFLSVTVQSGSNYRPLTEYDAVIGKKRSDVSLPIVVEAKTNILGTGNSTAVKFCPELLPYRLDPLLLFFQTSVICYLLVTFSDRGYAKSANFDRFLSMGGSIIQVPEVSGRFSDRIRALWKKEVGAG